MNVRRASERTAVSYLASSKTKAGCALGVAVIAIAAFWTLLAPVPDEEAKLDRVGGTENACRCSLRIEPED